VFDLHTLRRLASTISQTTWGAMPLGMSAGPEHLLLGVLEDARQPAAKVRVSRWHRQITAHVGLPEAYQGVAGFLLAALEVDLDRLRGAVTVTTPRHIPPPVG
jgi:hypothetical protein